MGAEKVVAAGLLNVEEIVFRCHLAERHNLDPVRLAVRREHKQVSEVAQPFRVAHRLAHPVNVAATLRRFGHVEDVPGVGTILVILAAEQRRRLIQPDGVKCAEVFRQAVQLLIDVRLQQVKHAARRKLMRLFPVVHKPVDPAGDPFAGEFCRGGFKAQGFAQVVAAHLGGCVVALNLTAEGVYLFVVTILLGLFHDELDQTCFHAGFDATDGRNVIPRVAPLPVLHG